MVCRSHRVDLLRCRVAVLALLLVALIARPAAAAPNDADVESLIAGILQEEYGQAKHAAALEKLELARDVCTGGACSEAVVARLWVAIGTVQAGGMANPTAARKAFVKALEIDASATLIEPHVSEPVRAAFSAAKRTIEQKKTAGCRGAFAGVSRPRRPYGWESAEAYFCYEQAVQAERAGDLDTCVSDLRASLELEDRVTTRAVLAGCLEDRLSWGDAIAEYEAVQREAPRRGLFTLARRAATNASRLQRRRPVLVLEAPGDADNLVVKLDGTALPIEVLNNELPVDPGPHSITAEGDSKGLPLTFEQDVDLEPGKTVTVQIRLAPGQPKWATRGELKCMLEAANADEFSKCVGSRGSKTGDLTITVGVEVSGYHDDMNVDVVTPSVFTSVEHVTEGWGLGASFLVDAVTAASTDILATASPRWREVRWAPGLSGHKRFGEVDIRLNGSLSHEPDYLALSVGGAVSVDLRKKTVTPSLGYEYSHDVNGRANTPFDVFSHQIDRHALQAGLGLVLTRATFGSVAFTMVFEDGDTSKPYRYVPLFRPEDIARVSPGLTVDAVNEARLPERPLEQLPIERARFALALGVAHRFTSTTLRASERLYIDDWGLKASTTDARFMWDTTDTLRLWPHLRFHAQSGTSFYQLAYQGAATPEGVLMPTLRTGDRELGPLWTLTAGAGGRLDFGKHDEWGLTLTSDFVYTRFLDHLFVLERLGWFGSLSVETKFE